MSKHIFKYYLEQHLLDWKCSFCSLPKLSDSFFGNDLQAVQTSFGNDGGVHGDVGWDEQINNGHGSRMCIPDFEIIAKEYNANSIAGHKFYEIRHWLQSGFFDILVISETKLDQTFPNSQFMIDGFRFLRIDRNIHGGGLMLYIRSDIPYKFDRSIFTEQREKYGTECIACEVKVGRS